MQEDCIGGGPTRLFYLNGVLYHNSSTRFQDIRDGLSNVFMVGETRYQSTNMSWASTAKLTYLAMPFTITAARDLINSVPAQPPSNWEEISRMFGSYHVGGCHFAMADGSVHFVSENINKFVYHELAIRNDGQPVGGF